MSEESTTPHLVERWLQAFEAGDRHGFDAVTSVYAPDAVWEVRSLGISLEGVAAIRGFMEDWLGSYAELEIEPEEIRDLGNGVTFGVFIQQGRPTGSVGHVRYRFAQVNTWVDDMIVRSTGHNDIDEARAAADRLAEETG
jgi:uncharacterized protein (TIGR02246 family)